MIMLKRRIMTNFVVLFIFTYHLVGAGGFPVSHTRRIATPREKSTAKINWVAMDMCLSYQIMGYQQENYGGG